MRQRKSESWFPEWKGIFRGKQDSPYQFWKDYSTNYKNVNEREEFINELQMKILKISVKDPSKTTTEPKHVYQ